MTTDEGISPGVTLTHVWTSLTVFTLLYAGLATTGIAIAALAAAFMTLYPYALRSTTGPSLTLNDAASAPYTLTIMSIVAFIFLPLILAHQAWTYWVFRHRITTPTNENARDEKTHRGHND